jgi:NADH:ubiquinone oxidoreductase subunit K
MFDIGLMHFVLVSILLASAGVACMLTKRNAIGILIGVELLLNAAAINLVAFNRYAWPEKPIVVMVVETEPQTLPMPDGTAPVALQATQRYERRTVQAIDGKMFAIFIIVLAAAEAAVALAIFLNFYHNFSTIDVERADALKG